MSVSVIVADDHPVFLDGLALLLETTAGIEVAGRAADGSQLLELAASVPFDVAVVDLDMPGMDGATATTELLRRAPGAAVLMLTMHDDAASIARAVRAGARGYVVKGAGHGAIVRAIFSAAEGDAVFSGQVGGHVLSILRTSPTPAHPGLTSRETELLRRIATGADNATVARELFLSTKTVQNNVSLLMAKLDASSRAHLVAIARDLGIGDGPGSGQGTSAGR
jgi:DNA-binding NarL/FixJ family response regulator